MSDSLELRLTRKEAFLQAGLIITAMMAAAAGCSIMAYSLGYANAKHELKTPTNNPQVYEYDPVNRQRGK